MLTINNRKKNPYLITEAVRIQKFNSFCYIGCSNFQITFKIKDYRLEKRTESSYFFLRPKEEVKDLASLALNTVVFSIDTGGFRPEFINRIIIIPQHHLYNIREFLEKSIFL